MFKNPLIPSSFVVYSFCYWCAGLALAMTGRAGLHTVAVSYVISLIATSIGAVIGLYMTLGAEAFLMKAREREVKAGHAHRGALLSLGRLPDAPAETASPALADRH